MLKSKKDWKHIENLREKWEDIENKVSNKGELQFCTNCGNFRGDE